MDRFKQMIGISSASNGSKDGKKSGGWVSPNIGGERGYPNGQRRQAPRVTQEQFNELKNAVIELQMGDEINDDIIVKACEICPNDNNNAIEQLLNGNIFELIK